MRCPKCGSDETGKFCSSCGTEIGGAGPKCSKCHAKLDSGSAFCAECGTPTGRKPSKPVSAYLPWVFSGLALVAFAVAIAFFLRGQAAPRVGEMGMTGGLPQAEPGAAMGGNAGAPSGGMADLSQMSPRQAADRLFERSMREEDAGDIERARFFANMAVQAYAAVPPADIDLDAHFHLGLLQLLQQNADAAAQESELMLSVRPNHLLGLILAARVAESTGDPAARAAAYEQFLAAFDNERTAGLPEYQMHGSLIDAEAGRAREFGTPD